MTFELVVFAFTPTTTIEQGLAAATRMDDYLRRAPGFISRQLFHDEAANQWVDLVAWRTRDEALAAMSGFPESPEARDIGSSFAGPPSLMLHPTLVHASSTDS
jgi:heme-degrading monooxygenase HmoA